MKYRILFITFINSLWGCQKNNHIKEEVNLLCSKSIILPLDSMHLINNFNDSLPLIGKESLKYIIFSDSTLCSSCELNRMYLWDCFLNKIKDLKGKVEVYFIFSPSSSTLNSFYFTMKVISPTSPIFVDTTNVFLRSNPHIPENPALHTFLLSEDNEVLLVGNPLENKRIEEMFWRIVKEK